MCCSAFYDYATAEYNTRLAADMLSSDIVHVLATITQQAALGKYLPSNPSGCIVCTSCRS
jgi:hypothetical protein